MTTLGLLLILSGIHASRAGDHREAHATAWAPGDVVPGWEDYDCGEPATGPVVTIEFPTTLLALVVVGHSDDGGGAVWAVDVNVADCVESGTCYGHSPQDSAYSAVFLDSEHVSGGDRGLGWYTYGGDSRGCAARDARTTGWCRSRARAVGSPACTGRRAEQTSVTWVEELFPRVAVRQWVLTVPWGRRRLLARRPELVRGIVAIAQGWIERW